LDAFLAGVELVSAGVAVVEAGVPLDFLAAMVAGGDTAGFGVGVVVDV